MLSAGENGRAAGAAPGSSSALLVSSNHNTPHTILTTLYHNRDRFSDVEIKCLDGRKISAHKAILAAREKFFADIFFPPAQLQAHPRARRAAKAIFPEESNVLQSIIEYLYTGVIESLENAPQIFPDDDGRLWIKTIMWCSRHDVKSVFDYVHINILARIFTTTCAAELLALVAHSAGAAAQTVDAPSEQFRARQIDELKELAITSFVSAPFTIDIFAPLSRVALKVLLQARPFQSSVRELEIIRAVEWWSRESAWVRNNVEAGVLTAENMTDITSLLNPAALPGPEFMQVRDLFTEPVQREVWKQIALILGGIAAAPEVHSGQSRDLHAIAAHRHRSSLLDLAGFAASARVMHSGSLRRDTSALRSAALSQAVTPSPQMSSEASVSSSMAAMRIRDSVPTPPPPQQLAPPEAPTPPVQGQFNDVGMFEQEPTGNVAPAVATIEPYLTPAEVRERRERDARSNPDDPRSTFHFGSGMSIQVQEPYVTLVSSDTTHHQSMLYKVGITSGTLRWSLEVVRPCDMLWMGVSSQFNLDTSQWAARVDGVWMASEESSCLAHIAAFTGPARKNPGHIEQMHAAHVGLTRLPCVRCIVMDPDEDTDEWRLVICELRIVDNLGELWMDVNQTGMQLVFHSLPTDKPLYPVLSVINAMQVKFTHLE